ncbi:MAG: hypothetical protein ACOYOH_07620 [Paracraurococcus sp.]
MNLPVADLRHAVAFYEAGGATANPISSDDTTACVVHSETVQTMLPTHALFLQSSLRLVADARAACQALLCLSAESRVKVKGIVARAGAARGTADPGLKMDGGLMHRRSFEDLASHTLEVMWTDMDAAKLAMAKD